jgi:ABC-type phosphate/phosphonate transport system substrate-binding protein
MTRRVKALGPILSVCLLSMTVFLLPICQARAGTESRPDLIFAYSNKIFTDVDVKDAKAALKIYADELAKQMGATTENRSYDSLEEMVRSVQKGSLDLVALSSLDYLRIRNKVEGELALSHMKGGKCGFKYLLLTKQNPGYTKLGDLKGKRLTIPKGDDTAELYLSTILLRDRLGDAKAFFSSVDEKLKPSQVVLSVFFSQTEACIVTDNTLKTMVEMNPQLGRDLKIMASSQELTTSITFFRRSLSDEMKQKTLSAGRTLKDNPRGRQVLLLFKIDDLAPLKESDLAGMKDLVAEHDRLRAGRR